MLFQLISQSNPPRLAYIRLTKKNERHVDEKDTKNERWTAIEEEKKKYREKEYNVSEW